MTPAQTIALYRPPLYALALKLVGSVHDAEDIIQETFLNWLSIDQTKIKNTKAYLTRMVVNNCINHVKAIKQRRQQYIENINTFEFFEKYDLSGKDISHELSQALVTLHLKLKPLEKAVFLLREVFNFEYDDLQEILDQRKDYCRQLLHRAKEKLAEETPHFQLHFPQHKELFETFKKACSVGQMSVLIDYLLK